MCVFSSSNIMVKRKIKLKMRIGVVISMKEVYKTSNLQHALFCETVVVVVVNINLLFKEKS